MKGQKYEHQSIKVGGWWGGWRVGGLRVHGVGGGWVGGGFMRWVDVVVWVVVGWLLGEFMGWVHILTHP